MAKVITLEDLNKLINSQEDKGDKKALLIVKSTLRAHKGPINKELLEKVVASRLRAEEAAGDYLAENDLDDLFEDLNNTCKHLGRVVLLSFGMDKDEEAWDEESE